MSSALSRNDRAEMGRSALVKGGISGGWGISKAAMSIGPAAAVSGTGKGVDGMGSPSRADPSSSGVMSVGVSLGVM